MTADSPALFCSAALLLLVGCAITTSATPMASAGPSKAQITILYDAFGKDSAMQKDWGYAALMEYGGKRILFDTGNNPDVLAQNAKAKGIDLSKLDFVVMSHRHGDHMGGMAYLLSVNPKVKIYAPKEGFGVYGADLPSTFYRKDPSLQITGSRATLGSFSYTLPTRLPCFPTHGFELRVRRELWNWLRQVLN